MGIMETVIKVISCLLIATGCFALGVSMKASQECSPAAQAATAAQVECVKSVNRLKSLDDCQEKYEPMSGED
jgi:hypothetical protein